MGEPSDRVRVEIGPEGVIGVFLMELRRAAFGAGVIVLAAVTLAAAGEEVQTAEKSIEESKLVGVWELTKVEGQQLAPHWRIEFSKEGKHRMTSKRDDKEYKVEGTYALKGDKLTLTVVVDGKTSGTQTMTIQTLTDEVLVLLDNNKKMEFKRGK
jgi:uncharacterized protein (TIGR03066 family)